MDGDIYGRRQGGGPWGRLCRVWQGEGGLGVQQGVVWRRWIGGVQRWGWWLLLGEDKGLQGALHLSHGMAEIDNRPCQLLRSEHGSGRRCSGRR